VHWQHPPEYTGQKQALKWSRVRTPKKGKDSCKKCGNTYNDDFQHKRIILHPAKHNTIL
jgi:hypothetical protein